MQGQILTADSTRSIILGDNGARYTFPPHEWRSDDKEPEVGMRVDFEVRGSEAADIYPIPGASHTPPIQQSSPAPSTTGGSSAQPRTGPSADERFKALLRRVHTELEVHYSPIRETIGNYGAIGVGIALLTLGAFLRFDILTTVLDIIAMLGMLVGAAVTAIGVFMLGKEEGWWGESSEPGASLPPSPGPAPKPREVSQEPPEDPPVAVPMRPAQSSDAPPARQDAPLERQSVDISRAQYPTSGSAYESGTTVQAGQSQRATSEEIPTKWMVALAIVPAILLILTLLPITPWFTHGGEDSTEYESLWDTMTIIRELESGGRFWRLNATWEGTLGAYVLAIIGAVGLAIAMFKYRQANERNPHEGHGDAAYDDRLDLFLCVSIFICVLTILSALFSWYFVRLGTVLVSDFREPAGYSLGPLLIVLAIVSMVGYLISLAANDSMRNRFRHISVSTFVSFKGRIRRPTFALITAPMHVQNLVSIIATLYVMGVYAPSPLDGYLLAPYGILIDTAEQHSSALLSWILPNSGPVLILQIAIFYLWLAACAKRYHDLDKSGWWVLVSFIPIVGPIWILIELGLKKGTRGYNSYGLPQEQGGADEQTDVAPVGEVSVNQDLRQKKACPYCADLIAPAFEVVKCRYCGSNIPTSQEASETQPARRSKTCPHCAESIMSEAVKCRYCGSEVPN